MLVRTSKDKEHPYVMLNKTFFEDQNLSLKAKGLLGYCMCKPDGWSFHVDQMATVLKEKKHSIYSAFKELIKFGYCIRETVREKDGKVKQYDYTLFEVPNIQRSNHENHPLPENQEPENQLTENQPLVINDNIIIKDSSDICAAKADASVSKKSKAKKIKTPTVIRRDHLIPQLCIETSEEDHKKLLDKLGQVMTNQCYESLQNWKISKWETDPQKVTIHTDYYRIIKWVAPDLKKNENNANKDTKWKNQTQNYPKKSPMGGSRDRHLEIGTSEHILGKLEQELRHRKK